MRKSSPTRTEKSIDYIDDTGCQYINCISHPFGSIL